VQGVYGGKRYDFLGRDAFIAKLTADGSALIYSTYLGGSHADEGNGIAIDHAGNAYVTGETESADFPTHNALGSYGGGTNPVYGNPYSDAFIAKLSADGRALVYSTHLGGSRDDWGYAIAVNSAGNAYVTGVARSDDFPIHKALDATHGGGECWINFHTPCPDAFIAKLTVDGRGLRYATFLGGAGDDQGNGIAVDGKGNVYVTGGTSFGDFPSRNALYEFKTGWTETFIAKLSENGSVLDYATSLGMSSNDWGNAITLDGAGNVYVTGVTDSSDIPTRNTLGGGYGDTTRAAFIAKLVADGKAIDYAVYLGGSRNPSSHGNGIAVDNAGNAYVTGKTESADFPTQNALDGSFGGKVCNYDTNYDTCTDDAFVTKISPKGHTLNVTKTGKGKVTSQPAGINCGKDCLQGYLRVTDVTLTATPDANSTFIGWGGACRGKQKTCKVTMSQARTVRATFKKK
jgi:hypothetical protein